MAQFKAQPTLDLATIREKVDVAETELVRLSRQAPQAAMRIELGTPEPDDEKIVARHREIQQRVETLRLALTAAEELERDRLASRLLADDSARRKATAEHVRRAVAALDKSSSAIQAAVAAFEDALNSVRSALAASPSDIKAEGFLAHAFSPGRLGRLWTAEIARLAEARGVENPLFRNAPYVADLRDSVGKLTPMHDLLAVASGRLKRDLATGADTLAARYPASAAEPSTDKKDAA